MLIFTNMCGLSCLDFMLKWRYWIRPFAIAFYAVVIIILLSTLILNSYKNGFNKLNRKEVIGGVFVMMALPISLWQIIQHMVHYSKPFLQKHIIRVLWLVPIFALNAWLGLVFPKQNIYVNFLRECYEAYAIYNFMIYLLNYLNSKTNLEANLEDKPQVHHFFPLCCLPNWKMGRELVRKCKNGTLQYTVVRSLTTTISFLCQVNGVYGEGEFKGDTAYPYMIFINNLSQIVAMYCLILFYKANKNELKPIKPVPKFLCIKAVAFFSFFQNIAISSLVFTGVIPSEIDTDSSDKVKITSSKLQNFLICIEMFLAAIAHHYSFTYKDFLSNKKDGLGVPHKVGCCNISDVHQDLNEYIGVDRSSPKRTLRGQNGYKMLTTENSNLLVPSNNTEDFEPNKYYLSASDNAKSCLLDEPFLSNKTSHSNTCQENNNSSSNEVEKCVRKGIKERNSCCCDEISNNSPDNNSNSSSSTSNSSSSTSSSSSSSSLVRFSPKINFGPEIEKPKI